MEIEIMDLSNKRCGECGARQYQKKTMNHRWVNPWKDFPSIFLMKPLELWICGACESVAITPGDAEMIDDTLEASVRSQTSQFLEIIKSKSGLSYEAIALRLGYTSAYVSSLKNEKKTPAFKLWNQLKSIATDPKAEMAKLDPDFDIIKHNLLLRF